MYNELVKKNRDIATQHAIATVNAGSHGFLEVQLDNADEAADYRLDLAGRGGDAWVTAKTWSSVTDINETLELVAGQARLYVSSPASAGSEADVLLIFDPSGNED